MLQRVLSAKTGGFKERLINFYKICELVVAFVIPLTPPLLPKIPP